MKILLSQHHFTFPSFIILMFVAPMCYCQDEVDVYEVCSRTFDCGNLENLSYPFWSENGNRPLFCGEEVYNLSCREGQNPSIIFESLQFTVSNINLSANMITVSLGDICPVIGFPITARLIKLMEILSGYGDGLQNISFFYECKSVPRTIRRQNIFECPRFNDRRHAFFTNDTKTQLDTGQCLKTVEVPVPRVAIENVMNGVQALERIVLERYNVTYNYNGLCSRCNSSGGICGTDLTNMNFICHCDHDHSDPYACFGESGDNSWKLKVIIGVSAGVGGALLVCLVGLIVYRRRKKNIFAPMSWMLKSNTTSYASSKSKLDIEESGGEFKGVHLFSYNELEEATNHFAPDNELGEGGFGTVYKGKLRDKRIVAVKRLYENNYKRVEQFLNEVVILTDLRHPNLVSLYGCTSRHSHELLLVYEYISNGTVADHLHGNRKKNDGLPWSIRMKIAVETATALTYLHTSEIIHRDVKTNNILLDNNFVVKVADFGLSRLFPTDVTHVSTAPQGTPGYVDPEYHECYQLTVKSDVYSFGVVLVELISSLPAVDITRHRHEINLSNMAINKIQSDALHELVDKNLGYESDYKVRKMITLVAELAFQCLQSAKEMRPSMGDVLENLKQIQGCEDNMDMAEDSELQSDHIGLLKNEQLPLSSDTVTTQWSSSSYSTTSNTSG